MYSPLWKITHQNPLVSCTSPFENHSPESIGFVYYPLWKITHQKPSVLCTPPFENSLFLVGAYFGWALISGWAFILANTVHHSEHWKWRRSQFQVHYYVKVSHTSSNDYTEEFLTLLKQSFFRCQISRLYRWNSVRIIVQSKRKTFGAAAFLMNIEQITVHEYSTISLW